MYGRPFGKSLCHAWGASPIYLLGKYYLGVRPLSPGYEQYMVEPELGGLEWMNGKVPTPKGEVEINMNRNKINIKTPSANKGTLRFKSKTVPVCKNCVVKNTGEKIYELELLPDREYRVEYKSL